MHPQVWKCSGHYDLFHDFMVDCRESKRRYRYDQLAGRWVEAKGQRVFVATESGGDEGRRSDAAEGAEVLQSPRQAGRRAGVGRPAGQPDHRAGAGRGAGPRRQELGTLTEPREFNLMFKTIVGAWAARKTPPSSAPKPPRAFSSTSRTWSIAPGCGCPSASPRSARASATRSRRGISPSARGNSSRWRSSSSASRPRRPQWYQYWRDRRYQLVPRFGPGRRAAAAARPRRRRS